MKRIIPIALTLAILLLTAGLAWVLGSPCGAVDWRSVRAVAFESDDWGLQGFVPAGDSWEDLDRDEIGPGRFPPVYWGSTLEDSSAVARLCAVMESHRGRDGLPAVFQPNYVMSALGWRAGVGSGEWIRYDLPELDPRYARPGMWNAVSDGRNAGVWYPEFHATWHYDPNLRREAARQPGSAREATDRGIMLFPGSERARELGSWRESVELAAELDHSLSVFHGLFGRAPGSVIAPDYTWQDKHEEIWAGRGLLVIQGKREQRNPDWTGGWRGRLAKVWDRSRARFDHPERVYLERNCRFEPAQSADADAAVESCVQQTRRAWRSSEPAIVETHRINFAHTDPAIPSGGLNSLGKYLDAVLNLPEGEPVFLTDWEIAQLQRSGTSWCVRGGGMILRNFSRTRRLVVVPAKALPGAGESTSGAPLFFVLGAGQTQFVKNNTSKS